jgi:hypothetical protein
MMRPSNEEEPMTDAPKTAEELQKELERLKAENESLKKRGSKGLSLKVSEKGAVSVYGMGRFPVTLYQEQWLKLLDMAEEIRAFIKENEGKLKKKPEAGGGEPA